MSGTDLIGLIIMDNLSVENYPLTMGHLTVKLTLITIMINTTDLKSRVEMH